MSKPTMTPPNSHFRNWKEFKNDSVARAKMIFGADMKPCPICSSYNLMYQTPIDIDHFKKTKEFKLVGQCYIMCCNCGHKGPSVDCSGEDYHTVKADPVTASIIRKLWNLHQPA